MLCFFFQAEDGIRDADVTGVQTCALPIFTSGAIGVGTGKLNLKRRPKSIRDKQAVAAVGQCELMHIYSKFFRSEERRVGKECRCWWWAWECREDGESM